MEAGLTRLVREIAFRTYRRLEAPLEPKRCGYFCYNQATPLESIKSSTLSSVRAPCL